jgi:hypothetical protein
MFALGKAKAAISSRPRGNVLMLYQPSAHLLGHDRLAGDRHLARPLTVDSHPELAIPRERQIDQFHFKAGAVDVILNDHAIMRFGTGDGSFYRFKPLAVSLILSPIVHAKVSSRAYRPRSNTS